MAQIPIDNTQPSLALKQTFVTSGVYPSRTGGAGGAFLDEIFTFAFDFAPSGTAGADGQLLPIAQNTAVFSIIGTTYGGDGKSNFALPDLRGVTMIGTRSPQTVGAFDGTTTVTLTQSQLPPDIGGTSQTFDNYQPSLPVTYMICVQGIFPSQNGGSGQDFMGRVVPFAGNYAPTDYLPADGRLLPIAQYDALFALIGTTYGGDGQTTFALPDLRGRTIIGASTAEPVGTLVGSPTVSLSNDQTPNGLGNLVQPFDNREPSLALNYLIALFGIYPTQNGGGGVDPTTPTLGEIVAFAGNFAPQGWAFCSGQLLPINTNQALFSLLGTTYGGDGRTTFALPDLRDRTVIGAHTLNGISTDIGLQPGANFHTITPAELATGPNPLPPAGTTADMILRGSNTSSAVAGQYEIYDIGNNSILAANSLGKLGTNWAFVTLGRFKGTDATGMLLRDSSTGGFEVCGISNDSITDAAFLGAVGLDWQVAGVADFNRDGMTDMMLRNSHTGAFEVYFISNNSIINAAASGTVGLDWQVGGFGNFSGAGESDMIMRNTSTGGLEVYFDSNHSIGAAFMGTVGLEWQIMGFGNFSNIPGESDMILRNTKTGGMQVYDIAHNQITGSAFVGTVGLDWQFAGIAPVRGPGASDLVLRNVNTGQFYAYNIANNQITGAAAPGTVGLEWQLGGFAADPPTASTASMGGSSQVSQLVQAMAGFGGGSGASDSSSTVPLGADTSQQTLLTTPQHA